MTVMTIPNLMTSLIQLCYRDAGTHEWDIVSNGPTLLVGSDDQSLMGHYVLKNFAEAAANSISSWPDDIAPVVRDALGWRGYQQRLTLKGPLPTTKSGPMRINGGARGVFLSGDDIKRYREIMKLFPPNGIIDPAIAQRSITEADRTSIAGLQLLLQTATSQEALEQWHRSL